MGKISYWQGVLRPCTISYSLRARGTNETKWPAYTRPLCNSQFQRCPSPRATAGHLLTLSVPGVGHSQFYRSPGSWALAYPGATPGHLTRDFERHISLSGRTKPLSKTGLSIRDQKNLSMFWRCLLNFRYFFINCKHININDKVNYILSITKQLLT